MTPWHSRDCAETTSIRCSLVTRTDAASSLSTPALAAELGCDRKTVGHMIDDLAQQGRLRRFRHRGPKGLVIQLLPLNGKADVLPA
jgi:hypothetical protein